MIYEIAQPVPILAGRGAVMELGAKLIKDFGVRKVVLVYDRGVKGAGIGDKVKAALEEHGLQCVTFDDIQRDAPDTNVDELGRFIRDAGADAVVALGGGSTLDACKGACTVAVNGGTIRDYLIQRPYRLRGERGAEGFKKEITYKQDLPLICVPTTSGTGSELRLGGVIYDTDLHVKDSVVYVPKLAVQDPELLVTMPPFITATTAFDAMAHANESMTSLIGQHKLRNTILGAGVTQTMFEWLPVVMDDPNNLEGREKIGVASSLAALCSIDGLAHIGHAIAETFNYNFDLPHGHACTLTLPVAIEVAAPFAVESVRHIALAQGLIPTGKETPEELGAMVAEKYRELARRCGIPSLKSLGVSRERMFEDKVVDDCFINDAAMGMFPSGKGITREQAIWCLEKIYDNYQ